MVGEEWERRKLKMYKRLSRERFEDGFGFFELRGLLESDLEFMYFGDLVILIRCMIRCMKRDSFMDKF